MTWHEGTAYGVTYRTKAGEPAEWTATLVRHGTAGRSRRSPRSPCRAGRTRRRCGSCRTARWWRWCGARPANRFAWLGRSRAPYTTWTWRETAHSVGGPNFIRLSGGDLWASGRSSGGSPTTVVARLTLDGRYQPALTLPSGGDTSYAGMVWHDGLLWVSYYSSHEGKTAIYLARVALTK